MFSAKAVRLESVVHKMELEQFFSSGTSISYASNNSTIAPEVCAKPDKPITYNSLGTYLPTHFYPHSQKCISN